MRIEAVVVVIVQLHVQSVPITTNVESSNPTQVRCTHTILCDKVCHCLAAGRWLSLGTLVSFANKTDSNDITEILLKVAFNTIILFLLNKNK